MIFLVEQSQVKFKTAGNTREEVFSAGVNKKCPILILADLFCGSIVMLCDCEGCSKYINGNLTNLYVVIRDRPSDFISEVMKLLYLRVLFQNYKEVHKYGIRQVQHNMKALSTANRVAQTAKSVYNGVSERYESVKVITGGNIDTKVNVVRQPGA